MRLRQLFLFFFLACAPLPALGITGSYFDMDTRRASDLGMFPKWTSVLARYEKAGDVPDNECEKSKYRPCDAIRQWHKMLSSIRGKNFREQLSEINSWGNAHPYIVDQINWGVEDYWETPNEFMAVNGDCEDYAIAKYYSLRALGVSREKLRIIVLQDFNLGGIIHAVLGVYDGEELLILDNQIRQVMPAAKIYHYRPIYAVNEAEWWEYLQKN